MPRRFQNTCIVSNEKGAVLIWVVLGMIMFIGITALSIDVGYLYGVRNELQDAADAGSLAGASMLYDDTGLLTPKAAYDEAKKVAEKNRTGNIAVTVESVRIGHWAHDSAHSGSITWYGELELDKVPTHEDEPDWWVSISASALDNNPDFINAVQVTTRRADTPSFFSRIFNFRQFSVRTDAVAYISFAGDDFTADQPIGVCVQAITKIDPNTGEKSYNCTRGRMLNSGSQSTHESAGWLDLDQVVPPECTGAANKPTISDDICVSGGQIVNTGPIDATGGTLDNVVRDLKKCWMGQVDDFDLGTFDLDTTGSPGPDGLWRTEDDLKDGIPDVPWSVTLPVINCEGNNVDNCSMVVGSVEVKIIWINRNEDPQFNDVPRVMFANETDSTPVYECADDSTPESRLACWNDFVSADKFNLFNAQDEPAQYLSKTIYFLPSCEVHIPDGRPTGWNFGILSEIPVLVE